MSQFPQQPIESMTRFHGCCNFTGLDIEEWLKDEDEQFANIERYEAALKNAQAVAAPEKFLAPHGNVLEGFLAPQGNVPQQVLDHVPAKSGPIKVPGYPKLNNIALSSDFHESSISAVPKKHFRWTREEQR